jgi:diguanylate cyclase (GGDEF)-like protein
MTSAHNSSVASADRSPLLEKALEKSQIVKDKIEGCALELFTVNETVKKEITAGITLQQAKKALSQSEGVEDKVQECADELHVVNKVLAKEIEDRDALNRRFMETERKLSAAKNILSNMANVLTVAHKVAKEATQRSLHDPVTGIPNRQLFSEHLEKAIALAQRGGWMLGVMFIDLDGFKPINDTHGHAVGDKVLKEVAQRLQEQLRSGDTACRYGGDEFLYLLVNPRNIENIEAIALKVLARISQTMLFNDLRLTIKPSIGIAVYPDGGNTCQELVTNADAAMYRAKKTKAGIFFDEVKDRAPEMREMSVKTEILL